ncbi:hypothetical protein Q9Q99_04590 [Curtobacterium flaccumfaciens]|nr:hypothetical protein Q9Q99_04590 [Curtobacterium flaccumfaciens]
MDTTLPSGTTKRRIELRLVKPLFAWFRPADRHRRRGGAPGAVGHRHVGGAGRRRHGDRRVPVQPRVAVRGGFGAGGWFRTRSSTGAGCCRSVRAG